MATFQSTTRSFGWKAITACYVGNLMHKWTPLVREAAAKAVPEAKSQAWSLEGP